MVLAVAAAIGYGVYSNQKADEAAADFCAGIAAGSTIGDAQARARRQANIKRVVSLTKDEYRFEFQGAPFHVGVCEVRAVEGKVIATRVYSDGD